MEYASTVVAVEVERGLKTLVGTQADGQIVCMFWAFEIGTMADLCSAWPFLMIGMYQRGKKC